MKLPILPLLLLATLTLRAEPPGIDQSSELLTVPAGDKFIRWYGHTGRSYFLQVSDPNDHLRKWTWAPIIEGGNDEEISYEVDGTADKGFFRLKYTNQLPGPGETLETADFDLDGLSNLDEISPLPPLFANAATDPLANDTDKDGLKDGFERENGYDPNNADENNNGIPDGADDSDGDGFSNAAEADAGSNPNDPNNKPGDASWHTVTGDKPQGEPKNETKTFTIKKGESRLVVVGLTSEEYPQYTGEASEFDDTLEWKITPSSGAAINGSVNVNDLHEEWEIDEILGVTLNGFGPTPPAHIEQNKIIQAPLNADLTVKIELTATNVSDGILPSTVIVGLLPVEIVDKNKNPVSTLRVGKMSEPGVLGGTGATAVLNIDNDPDRFFIRIKNGAALDGISVKVSTTDNPVALYNDNATEIELDQTDGEDSISKSLLLVSDDVDDKHPVNSIADDDKGDRTHKIQLGGKFNLEEIKIGAGNWMTMGAKTLAPVEKIVKVKFVNCQAGIPFFKGPCWSTPWIDFIKMATRERFAQSGINLDFSTVAGPDIGVSGWLDPGEFPTEVVGGVLDIPQETKDIINAGPTPAPDEIMIYLVTRLDGTGVGVYHGVAIPPKYLSATNKSYGNKIFAGNPGAGYSNEFTCSHELMHVLLDAIHGDYPTEYSDDNMLWHETIPNQWIDSTKRMSKIQSDTILLNPLAK